MAIKVFVFIISVGLIDTPFSGEVDIALSISFLAWANPALLRIKFIHTPFYLHYRNK